MFVFKICLHGRSDDSLKRSFKADDDVKAFLHWRHFAISRVSVAVWQHGDVFSVVHVFKLLFLVEKLNIVLFFTFLFYLAGFLLYAACRVYNVRFSASGFDLFAFYQEFYQFLLCAIGVLTAPLARCRNWRCGEMVRGNRIYEMHHDLE